jgi:hypothetical protein
VQNYVEKLGQPLITSAYTYLHVYLDTIAYINIQRHVSELDLLAHFGISILLQHEICDIGTDAGGSVWAGIVQFLICQC